MCEHSFGADATAERRPYSSEFAVGITGAMGAAKFQGATVSQGAFCQCGAWRGQLGLEPTIDAFVAHIVQVFREIKRVLRPDGIAWCNIGDSYAGSMKGINADGSAAAGPKQATNVGSVGIYTERPPSAESIGLKPKDLCLIPFRVALALQSDGWWVRSDVIWNKPATMPESVTDRPTRSHEYIFLLSKNATYFYDDDAIKEPASAVTHARIARSNVLGQPGGAKDGLNPNRSARRALTNFATRALGLIGSPGPNSRIHRSFDPNHPGEADGEVRREEGSQFIAAFEALPPLLHLGVSPKSEGALEAGSRATPSFQAATANFVIERNKRDVWTMAAEPNRWALCKACRYVSERWPECRLCGGTDDACARCAGKRVCPQCGGREVTGHFACVDEETDCLTSEGWKKWFEVKPGMLAAQYDLALERFSWGAVKGIASYSVLDETMVAARCRDLDMILTPDHRCVVKKRHPETRKAQRAFVVKANHLVKDHLVPTSAKWDYDGDTSIPIEWAELLGWYIAEGHESKDSASIEIYQSRSANEPHVERIEQLLRQIGAEWTKSQFNRMWRGRPSVAVAFRVSGHAAYRLRELAPGKAVPVASLLWSEDRISALMDGLIFGDGHTRKDDGRKSFIQKDKARADMVQALAIRLGKSACVRPHGDVNVVYITDHPTRSFRGTDGVGADIGTIQYSGMVWCPQMPKGTWLARRGGRVFVTGNSFPPELPETCILAGTSEKGCCSACAAPWERVTRNAWNENGGRGFMPVQTASTGWQPTCGCEGANIVPCTVLDTFLGSGTTLETAERLGRRGIGLEMSQDYIDISRARTRQRSLFSWRQPTELPSDDEVGTVIPINSATMIEEEADDA